MQTPLKITLVDTQTINTSMSSIANKRRNLFYLLHFWIIFTSRSSQKVRPWMKTWGPLGNSEEKKHSFFIELLTFFYDSDILTLRYRQLLHMRIHIFDDSTDVLLCCLQKGYSTHQTLISKVQYLFLYHFNFSTSFNTPIQKWLQLTMSTLIELNQRYCSSPEIESSMTPWFLERL